MKYAVFALCLLSGCLSLPQVSEDTPIAAEERIVALLREENGLALAGVQYRYTLRPHLANRLMAVLAQRWRQPFAFTEPYSGKPLQQLPIVLTAPNHFTVAFCLDYRTRDILEQAALQSLGFQRQYVLGHYRRCFALAGNVSMPHSSDVLSVKTQGLPATVSWHGRVGQLAPALTDVGAPVARLEGGYLYPE